MFRGSDLLVPLHPQIQILLKLVESSRVQSHHSGFRLQALPLFPIVTLSETLDQLINVTW